MSHVPTPISDVDLRYLRKNRQARENDGAFDSLIATPHDFGSIAAGNTSAINLSMPAPGRLALSHDAALDAEDITINVAGSNLDFSHPALLEDEIHRFHSMLDDVSQHLESGDALVDITPKRLLQGPFSDVMTHAGQLAMLRRLHGVPVPPENFVLADIEATNVSEDQADPSAPDQAWSGRLS